MKLKKLEHKTLIGLLIFGIILTVPSCLQDTSAPYQKKKEVTNKQTNPSPKINFIEQFNGYQTIIEGPDGCDYIYGNINLADITIGGITHSGSCRKCWARLDSLINNK